MMPCKFAALDGSIRQLDLDSVYDVALGYSARRSGWTSTVVYDPMSSSFVELRTSPPDYRGNAAEEAEEVSAQYMLDVFNISSEQVEAIREAPDQWTLIDNR